MQYGWSENIANTIHQYSPRLKVGLAIWGTEACGPEAVHYRYHSFVWLTTVTKVAV